MVRRNLNPETSAAAGNEPPRTYTQMAATAIVALQTESSVPFSNPCERAVLDPRRVNGLAYRNSATAKSVETDQIQGDAHACNS
jgi:hypothetical protein